MSIASRIEQIEEHIEDIYDTLAVAGGDIYVLPRGYTQVDYVESTGTQFIDTGVKLSENHGFDIKFLTNNAKSQTSGEYGCVLGGRDGSGNKDYQLSTYNTSMLRWGTGTAKNAGITIGEIQTAKVINKVFTNCLGTTYELADTSGQSSYNCYLFGLNTGGSFTQSGSGGCRIYYIKFYDGSTMIRDFIPCFRNKDNEIGFYDLVEGKFYSNAGTGTFTYGTISKETKNCNIVNINSNLKELLVYYMNNGLDEVWDNWEKVIASGETLTLNNTLYAPMSIDLKGNTYQFSTTGINFLPNIETQTINGITITNNRDGSYTLNGTASAHTYFDFFAETFDSTQYVGYYLKEYNYNNISSLMGVTSSAPISYRISKSNRTSIQAVGSAYDNVQILDNGSNLYLSLRITNGGSLSNVVIKPMLVANSSGLTANVEPYTGGQPSPSPDYPQDIEVVTGLQEVDIVGKNLFDKNTSIADKRISSSTGAVDNYTDCSCSDYINVTSLSKIILSGATITYANNGAFYDKNKTYISGFNSSSIKNGVNVPNNAKYVRFSTLTVDLNTTQLEKNSQVTPYKAFESQNYQINLGKNLANVTLTHDYVSSSGSIETASNNKYLGISNNIPVKPDTQYTISFTDYITGNLYYGAFNQSGTFIERVNVGTTDRTFTTGNDVYFIRPYFYNSTEIYDDLTGGCQLELGSQATPYSPYFTPIELCKIGDYRDRIKKSTGKNLFDKSITPFSTFYTDYLELDTGVRAIATRTGNNRYMGIKLNGDLLLGKTITISLTITPSGNNNGNIRLFFTSDSNLTTKIGDNLTTTGSLAFTIPNEYADGDDGIAIVFSSNNNGTSVVGDYVDYTNIIVNIGNETEYEPYGTNWYIKKEIGKVVLDGSETIKLQATLDNVARFAITDVISNAAQTKVLSEYFKWYESQNTNTTFNDTSKDNEAIHVRNDLISLGLKINKIIASDASSLQTWLSTHNTIVYYVLATPTYETITQQELINQLNKILEVKSYNEQTNISQETSNLPFILDATALKNI